LSLSCEFDENVPDQLVGDPLRLNQIAINLVGNAIKFTEQGRIEVRVVADSLDPRAALLHFSVTDSGIGIPADKLASIFDLFTQADASMTRKYGGTGLGLTISKRLVHLMGGEIWVDSEPGKGSTFHFTAAFARAARDAAELLKVSGGKADALPVVEPQPAAARDFDYAAALASAEREILDVLSELFLEQYPASLDEIAAAIAAADSPTLERSAHALKGLLGYFRAAPAQQAARELEELGARGQAHDGAEPLARLRAEIEKLRPHLVAYAMPH